MDSTNCKQTCLLVGGREVAVRKAQLLVNNDETLAKRQLVQLFSEQPQDRSYEMLEGGLRQLATLTLQVNSPSLIIVGSVVSLRRGLDCFYSNETPANLARQQTYI